MRPLAVYCSSSIQLQIQSWTLRETTECSLSRDRFLVGDNQLTKFKIAPNEAAATTTAQGGVFQMISARKAAKANTKSMGFKTVLVPRLGPALLRNNAAL